MSGRRRVVAALTLIAVVAAGILAATGSRGLSFPWTGSNPTPSAISIEASQPAPPQPSTQPQLPSNPPSVVASPTASPPPPSAPTSAVGFKPRATVVPIGFPLPAGSHYVFGSRWRAPRAGRAYSYNLVRGVAPDGSPLRAHDGVDLEVAVGTPVLAPFDGRVIDPTTRWRPWDRTRFGISAVVVSNEPSSQGYTAIMAHLSRLAVALGDSVVRGQVVGWTGRTGNATETVPHLHFELRAPFLIPYAYAGIRRRLDVFDPEPSLRAADPHGG